MSECWLRPNRRMLRVAALATIVTIVAGGLIGSLVGTTAGNWFGGGLAGAAVLLAVATVRAAVPPRISLCGGALAVVSGPLASAELPLDDVEAFFLGQGPVVLPLLGEQSARCTNLVVRIAQRAEHVHAGDVAPWVGDWSDGYFVIRGTWCEPLDTALAVRLNERLAVAKQSAAPSA
jgi:hypothetical protein